MKMSRSIKEYKDAMDSIRISDSFYKRTETLLSELSEVKIEKNRFSVSKKITAGIMAAAACVVCVIGVRIVTDVRNGNIESVSETGLTEITMETTESFTSPELIDIIEEEEFDEAVAFDGSDDSFDDTSEIPDSASAPFSVDGGGSAAETVPVSEGGSVSTGKANDTGAAVPDRQSTGYPDIPTNGTDNIPMLDDISFENVTVEITPYFNMENIISGESSIKKNGTECRELIEFICDLSENAYEIPNSSFKSLFLLNISDENIDVTFYSIYITDQNTVVITKHSADGQQRVSYGITADKYKELKHMIFLMFGTESDYELFENLVSGK